MNSKFLKYLFSLVILALHTDTVMSQCTGAKNGGAERVFLLNTGVDVFNFDINGLALSIEYDNVSNVTVKGPTGMSFLADGSGFAQNISQNTDIASLGPYVSGSVKLFDTSIGANGYGTFGGGIGGFVAFNYMGSYGWIELDLCGRTACSDYRFTVNDALYQNQVSANVLAGVCPAIQSTDVPTISQWGLIILFQSMLILGIISVRNSREKSYFQ